MNKPTTQEVIEAFEKDFGSIKWDSQQSYNQNHFLRLSRYFYNKGLEDARNGGPEIDPKDIRKGDTIRVAVYEPDGTLRKYREDLTAHHRSPTGWGWDNLNNVPVSWDRTAYNSHSYKHYLINRPEPAHPDPKKDLHIRALSENCRYNRIAYEGDTFVSDGHLYHAPGYDIEFRPEFFTDWERVEL